MRTLPALVGLALCLPAAASAQTLEVDGFSWAENLHFDGLGNLWVSDSLRGEVWRIQPGANGYSKSLFLDGFSSVLGLVSTDDGQVMYAAANLLADVDNHVIIRFHRDAPGQWTEVAQLPKGPNGLEMDDRGRLYATTEGNFLPGDGEVYRIDPRTGGVEILMDGLWAADGIAIDRTEQILYVGEVISSRIWMYDLRSDTVIGDFQGLVGKRLMWLDDFTCDPGTPYIYGTDFARGTVVRIEEGTDLEGRPDIVARDFAPPTSVAFGAGPGFRETSLYVTEGGGVTESVTDRRVVEIPNVREAARSPKEGR